MNPYINFECDKYPHKSYKHIEFPINSLFENAESKQ